MVASIDELAATSRMPRMMAAIGPQAAAFKIGMLNGAYFNGRVAAPKFFSAAVSQALREYVFLCERPLIG